ncbi:Leucine-rich repeat, immunoglobulin-like domain and transmembrane domain-containing protein 3 [Bagarius yarrelli]|nr:Leucine-rich repeat, immunoglobulin-like domain and transmembrane domain-containing protein 3 [Bagarius yarrelli]
MLVFLCLGLSLFTGRPVLSAACPALCSCFYHKLSDGSKARSVLCSDPTLTTIPTDFPSDVSKLQIEKTDITQISSEAFISLRNLEFLWMSFNSLSLVGVNSFRGLNMLSELRLEGNFIASFPWESLIDMPSLRLLDLHNNRISSIPAKAAAYIRNLTYLDLSSNSLTTVPPEVLLMWFSAKPPQEPEIKMIWGLHDNPWQCDCRLFDLVQFQKTPSSTSTFIDTHLRCSEPERFSGVLFPDVKIQRCEVPRVHTAMSRVHGLVGDNVLLRCGTVGVPTPQLTWSRADGKAITGTIHEEVSAEGITWSVLSIHSAASVDSGKYVCRATNFVGSTNAMILFIVSEKRQLSEAL